LPDEKNIRKWAKIPPYFGQSPRIYYRGIEFWQIKWFMFLYTQPQTFFHNNNIHFFGSSPKDVLAPVMKVC
ncbi:hypothetical protein, partial [Geobacillus stearothermophilus]|uniref:hypothetical protein n=1 Tax=Geobacillus stearothermophilus TaxID=1422 RepID=UPI002E1CEBCA|nr:hypothetical protein [Geobacillus stearothermophilus]